MLYVTVIMQPISNLGLTYPHMIYSTNFGIGKENFPLTSQMCFSADIEDI